MNTRIHENTVEIGIGTRDTNDQVSAKFPSVEEIHRAVGAQAYLVTKLGILSISVISKGTAVELSLPCLWTNSSSLSFRLPTTMTLEPSSTNLVARASPMPDVPPMTRTLLYWKGMIDDAVGLIGYFLFCSNTKLGSGDVYERPEQLVIRAGFGGRGAPIIALSGNVMM